MEKCRNKIDPWWKLNPGVVCVCVCVCVCVGGSVRFRVGAPEQRDVKRNESGS